ncbi:hypothetical protein QZH56_15610 [Streptomyces olivoreticuli]|uniref:hypothetical protein n=1 Tax=Streptomyces olivoreticuli TaxID=68246 RepID=UPI00265B2C55|nr:hypothetical protein [Streptomyces olivoreticuli]WKK26894.1 hypothetical protein QZH56_15610 [Streptomyces olivoreticuli]
MAQEPDQQRRADSRRLAGYAFVTNESGHPLMVTGPDQHLAFPGGETIADEPAVQPAAYHLRRLGLSIAPGPILSVDHMEAYPLGGAPDVINFLFYCGKLTAPQVKSIATPKGQFEFVNPKFFHWSMTRYQRRCLDVALDALTNNTGCPYLRNGLRISHLSVSA